MFLFAKNAPLLPAFLIAALMALSPLFAAETTAPFQGYTFYASGKNCYLYDHNKTLVHTWTSTYSVAGNAELLRDSSVMFPCSDRGDWRGSGPLPSGRFQIIKWDGTVFWDFPFRSATFCPHHNICLMYYTNTPKEIPNLLVTCYTSDGTNRGDRIVELKRTGPTTGEVVWEWYVMDHSVPAGTGTDKPEALDLGKGYTGTDWTHVNYLSYNRVVDQVIFDNKGFNEVMVLDHSTTIAQAKGTTGGRYGKGGQLLYRWGMPANYGVTGARQLNGQHSGCWVLDTMPGTNLPIPDAGNILAISNVDQKAVEITPPGNKTGVYPRTAGTAFAPTAPAWTYTITGMARSEGSIQKLPNGNYFINNNAGSLIEVTPAGTAVWSHAIRTSRAIKYA
ncbi:MAG: hypothetical protein JXA71_06425, partial [Chitinispirillaceae bacterium]|nr:hypothetical protein [Chitinispirillaceae bacterium]